MSQDNKPLVKSFDELGREVYGADFSGDFVVEELRKALATGVAGSPTGSGDATPIRLENLDPTMTKVLYTEEHLKLFKSLPRTPSAQPLFQWVRKDRYGSNRAPAGFAEGEAPRGSTSKWTRNTIYNKYMGVRRGYTHQALITGNLGGMMVDPVAEENSDGTLELMEKIERWLIFGDSAILNRNRVDVNYDGLLKQILAGASDSVVDKQGAPLTFDDFEDIAVRLRTVGKLGSFSKIKTFMSPGVMRDFARLKQDSERRDLAGSNAGGFVTGTPINGHQTQFGYIGFDDSIFMEHVEGGKALSADEPDCPAQPATSIAVGDDATSKLPVGTFYYFVSSVSEKGESAAVAATGSGAVTATGKKITATITRVTTTGDAACIMYRVYRATSNSLAAARFVGYVAQPESGNATFVDLGQTVPDTGLVLGLHMDPRDITIAQMAPLIKFPLAIVNTTIEFLLLLYHVLVVKAPERMFVFKNVGKLA